jgi:hypothetical protein
MIFPIRRLSHFCAILLGFLTRYQQPIKLLLAYASHQHRAGSPFYCAIHDCSTCELPMQRTLLQFRVGPLRFFDLGSASNTYS